MQFEPFTPTKFDECQRPGVFARMGGYKQWRFDTQDDADSAARMAAEVYAAGRIAGRSEVQDGIKHLLNVA